MKKNFQNIYQFIGYGERLTKEYGRTPRRWMNKRNQVGVIQATRCFVDSEKISDGLLWAVENGLEDYTLEAAVLRFPHEFNNDEELITMANWRLSKAKELTRSTTTT
jgi:hypothetical protein